jgi:hypothetical protein
MAGRKKRASSGSDSAEAVKPLIVLILLGTILYGGYSVIQKGRKNAVEEGVVDGGEAPAFATQQPEIAPETPTAPLTPPVVAAPFEAAPTSVGSSLMPPPAVSLAPAAAEVAAVTGPTYVAGREGPPPSEGTDFETAAEPPLDGFARQPADPYPDFEPPAAFPGEDAEATQVPVGAMTPLSSVNNSKLAAFTADWDEAHEQLKAGRYAESLTLLSTWYDDPDLAVEEGQRLEDLLGQLAGTVIYSQQDLLMPPHVVGVGETLPAIAAPLGVNWQLLAKINGVPQPDGLVPGESLKVFRGPFDGEISLSRRRLTLRLTGNYAGSFPLTFGEAVAARAGDSLAVIALEQADPATAGTVQQASFQVPDGSQSMFPRIRLEGDILLVAAEDPAVMAHEPPPTHLVVSRAHLADLIDILTPASRVTIGR